MVSVYRRDAAAAAAAQRDCVPVCVYIPIKETPPFTHKQRRHWSTARPIRTVCCMRMEAQQPEAAAAAKKEKKV